MYYWLLLSSMFSKPSPQAIQSPGILSTIFSGGLASILLVLVTLLLLAVIILVLWMFMTGRWRTVRATEVNVAPSASPATSTAYAGGSFPPEAPHMPPRPAPSYPEEPRAPLPSKQPQPEDLLRNTRWLRLAEDCVDLFDELDSLSPRLDSPRQEIVRHVKYRLQEILNRSGVTSISRGSVFDDTRHQLEQVGTTTVPGTPITKFVSPGFVVDGRVLRRAKVQVSDTLQEDVGSNL